MDNKKNQKGFTIIEIMLAIVLTAVIVAISYKAFRSIFGDVSAYETVDEIEKTYLDEIRPYVKDRGTCRGMTPLSLETNGGVDFEIGCTLRGFYSVAYVEIRAPIEQCKSVIWELDRNNDIIVVGKPTLNLRDGSISDINVHKNTWNDFRFEDGLWDGTLYAALGRELKDVEINCKQFEKFNTAKIVIYKHL